MGNSGSANRGMLNASKFLERFLLCYWLNYLFVDFYSIFATLLHECHIVEIEEQNF